MHAMNTPVVAVKNIKMSMIGNFSHLKLWQQGVYC